MFFIVLFICCRNICEKLLLLMRPDNKLQNGGAKVLNAPVNMGTMAANQDCGVEEIKSIWVTTRDDGLVSFLLYLNHQ
jgi:ATP-binding cassette subfamily F protein 3